MGWCGGVRGGVTVHARSLFIPQQNAHHFFIPFCYFIKSDTFYPSKVTLNVIWCLLWGFCSHLRYSSCKQLFARRPLVFSPLFLVELIRTKMKLAMLPSNQKSWRRQKTDRVAIETLIQASDSAQRSGTDDADDSYVLASYSYVVYIRIFTTLTQIIVCLPSYITTSLCFLFA